MFDRLRRAIEAALPWYDRDREAEKDRRVEATVRRVDYVTRRFREEAQKADDRLAGRT